jgi:ATP/maltotriose-dependent transcriptional regulator MalT
MNAAPLVLEGRAAYGRRAWGTAYAALDAADRAGELAAADIERLAVAGYLTGHDAQAIDVWTRAHHAYLREGSTRGAVLTAFWLGFLFLYRNERSRANGWFGRARRIAGEENRESAEFGYLLFAEAIQLHWMGDSAAAKPLFETANELATRLREPDLAAFARLGIGDALVQLGEVSAGMSLLDEVMASVTEDDVSSVAVGIVYCAVLGSCQHSFEVRRAHEWTAAFSEWCEAQPELIPFRGECVVHRAEIMQLQGSWPAALAELARVCEGMPSDHFVPWAGEAYYQLGEIERQRGNYAEAEAAYRQASQQGYAVQPGFALMRLAQGREDAAVATINRLLTEASDTYSRARVLRAHAEIMQAAGDLDAAQRSIDELILLVSRRHAPFLQAVAAHAAGCQALARGDAMAALPPLRGALECWRDLDAPYEAARTRVQISAAYRALGDVESAEVELATARAVFERLGARPDLDRLDYRAPPAAASGGLTERELEVLRLVAAGKSNRGIADQLTLSEHTVRRHLQNAFAKLEVSSRAAATAYAYEHGLI